MIARRHAVAAFAAILAASGAAVAAAGVPAYIESALRAPVRPAADVARDVDRKPAELLQLAGVKPGSNVVELVPENGYAVRILSGAVGATGHVYMFIQTELNDRPARPGGAPGPGKALPRARDIAASLPNVSVVLAPTNGFTAPEKLDVAWMTLNYHDLHTPTFAEAVPAQFDKAVFDALKPGGVFFIVDHYAEPGSGLRDTRATHRIDPQVVEAEVEGAGFRLEVRSDLLRNPADDHRMRVFDPAIRGHIDQFILKFRKPYR